MLGRLKFSQIAKFASVICVTLFFVWTFAPQVLLNLWQIDSGQTALLLSRRSGALFLGFGVMMFMVRHAPNTAVRNSITTGLTTTCAALAVLGCYDFIFGHAGTGILLAVTVETVLALVLFATRNLA